MLADERNELLRCNEKCDCVNETKQSENNESGEPIGIAAMEKHSEGFLVHHCKEARLPRPPNVQRPTLKTDYSSPIRLRMAIKRGSERSESHRGCASARESSISKALIAAAFA